MKELLIPCNVEGTMTVPGVEHMLGALVVEYGRQGGMRASTQPPDWGSGVGSPSNFLFLFLLLCSSIHSTSGVYTSSGGEVHSPLRDLPVEGDGILEEIK